MPGRAYSRYTISTCVDSFPSYPLIALSLIMLIRFFQFALVIAWINCSTTTFSSTAGMDLLLHAIDLSAPMETTTTVSPGTTRYRDQEKQGAAPNPTPHDARPLERDDGDAITLPVGSSPDLVSGSLDSVSEASDDEWTGDGGLKRARDDAPSHSERKRLCSRKSGSDSDDICLGVRRRAIVRSFVEANPSGLPDGESVPLIKSIMIDAGIPPIRPDSTVRLIRFRRPEAGLEAPTAEARNPEATQRILIVDAFVKEHHQQSNWEMLGPINALFEAANIPAVPPSSLDKLIAKSRARQGLLFYRREACLEAPTAKARNPETGRRMRIIDAYVKEHHRRSNPKMLEPLNALFEAENMPAILPCSLGNLISKSRARQGLLSRQSSRMSKSPSVPARPVGAVIP